MTTKGTDNRFRSLTVVGESGTPATPASGDFKLYVADDGTFYLMDDTGTPTAIGGGGFSDPMTTRGDIIVRNASNVTARLAKGSADTYLGSDGTDVAYSAVTDAKLSTSDITTNNASTSKHGFLKKLSNSATDYMDGTGNWSVPTGSGGTSDPIADFFGTPDTAYEFASSSLTGLTGIGTLTAEDADTTVPDHYYAQNKQNSNPYIGGRKATVSQPFTGIVKVAQNASRNYHSAGIFVTDGTLYEMALCGYMGGGTDGSFHTQKWNSQAGGVTQLYNGTYPRDGGGYVYLAIRANSGTSVDYFASDNGFLWVPMVLARNPGVTLNGMGPVVMAQETTYGNSAAFDFFRIWNSAKTFIY